MHDIDDTNVYSAGYSGISICPLTCIQFGFELESSSIGIMHAVMAKVKISICIF